MSSGASPPADDTADRRRVLEFFEAKWPPQDAKELYRSGWSEFPALGKAVCLRAALASYEAQGYRCQETGDDRSARRAVEAWVLNPSEELRKAAGRIASVPLPQYSLARTLANVAGRRKAWPSSMGYGLTTNPNVIREDEFRAIRDAIEAELLAWARGEGDPVAERYHHESMPRSGDPR